MDKNRGTVAKPGDETKFGMTFTIPADCVAVRDYGWIIVKAEDEQAMVDFVMREA